MSTRTKATIEDLYQVEGKAELVNGEIVRMSPTGGYPGHAEDEIYSSLREYALRTKRGKAFADGKGFLVNLPHRTSFSPDAAFYTGKVTPGFLPEPPLFAVEVQSENDYGPAAEREMAAKRADYFAAGTQVVWDVDVLRSADVVRVYHYTDPDKPTIYRRSELAGAEPALPGWKMPVDDLFFDPTE